MTPKLLCVSLALATVVLGAPAPAATLCEGPGPQAGRVAGVDARLELTLDDGTRLGLAGLDPALPTPERPELDVAGREALAAWLVGKSVTFRPLAGRPDRWGRLPALVYLATGAADEPVSVGVTELERGFARLRPDPGISACQTAWRAVEAAARSARLGLWADPYYAILRAADPADTLAERAGSLVLFEGVLREVRANGVRTMLVFAPREAGRRSLVVTVLQRKVVIFDGAGLGFRALIGRRLRIRGLLETRFGPHIEIASPDEIEVLAVPGGGSPEPAGVAAGEVR